MRRSDAFGSLDRVLNEFVASRFALARSAHEAAADPTILAAEPTLSPSHLAIAESNVEVTYTLRLFAEFEYATWDYWQAIRRRGTPRRTRMEILIDRVAARQYVDTIVLQRIHEVREYRNDIVHHRLRERRLKIHECRSRMARFLSYLPPAWG